MAAEPAALPEGPTAEPRLEWVLPGTAGRRPRGQIGLFGNDPDAARAAAPGLFPSVRWAQFQLPAQNEPREGVGPARQEARELAKELDFQYTFGSDTEYTYLRNLDLNRGLRDNLQTLIPTVFALGTFRPFHWIDVNLGATFEQQLRIKEEVVTIHPDGSREIAPRRGGSAKIDVANIVLKNLPDHPIEVTIGRRDFEDPRLFLYDTTLDGVHFKYKGENYSTEMSYTHEDQWDLAVFQDVPKSSISNYILYHEYRGIEDHKIGVYAIARLDQLPRSEGRPKFLGARAYGRPADEFNYWVELGIVRGADESATPQPLHGNAFDYGATYRFQQLPLRPCVTAAVAYGSGDGNARDGVNREYRQTGLQSNETKFCGPAMFKRYGEFMDPELSNLRIFTFGFGFRPSQNIHVDIVQHRFELNQSAQDTRGSAITAIMNRVPGRLSTSMGQEIDLIVAFRRLFDTKFSLDLRVGRFIPGSAFLRNDGNNRNPVPRQPNRGLSVLAILSY